MPHALLVDDDTHSLEALEELIRGSGFTSSAVRNLAEARSAIESRAPDLAILELTLPDGEGLELVRPLREDFETEIVVLANEDTIDAALGALRAGARDCLSKPLDAERVARVVAAVKRTLELRGEVSELRDRLRRLGRFDRMVGSSPAMQHVYELVTRVARTASTVLIQGETGTGKELVAWSVHRLSERSDRPLVPVNCGAIQPDLIESELFGHEKGAFTGAQSRRKGLFEQASSGTLFLDEITEMPADLQVKLLRVLESRSIRRVGGNEPIPVDVRLMAATNREPEEAVREGRLREDLLYRLRVFPIRVPPLRERRGDIELLASFFLEELNEGSGMGKRFKDEALELMAAHDWPGNVRELRNVVERAFILAKDRIGAEHVRLEPSASTPAPGGGLTVEVGCTVAEAERRLILATLESFEGDKKRAAETLGISLKTLYNRLNTYGLGRRASSISRGATPPRRSRRARR